MAWIKVPTAHHPIFRAALPADRRVQTLQMFGGVAAKVNGHIFAGLFGRSAMVNLSDPDRAEALALDGASYFDPMGDGVRLSKKIMLPEDVFHDPDDLRAWLRRGFDYTLTLPKKAAKPKPKPKAKPDSAPKKPATPRRTS